MAHNPQQPRNPGNLPSPERIEELLAQHTTEGLSTLELEELRDLGVSEDEIESMELAAAAAHVAMLGTIEPMPAHLRARVASKAPARGLKLSGTPAAPRDRGTGTGLAPWMGWVAAAAALVLAVLAWWPSARPGPTPSPSIEAQRQSLLAQGDVLRGDWSGWGDSPAVDGVQGDVVWSPERQEGYMRFRGLAPNNPGEAQYQLWIVDAARGEPLKVPPVDGGVFDVAGRGEVIVPIRAKLPVGQAVAFAITVEPPGGVVVSDQSRKVVVAMVQR
jgi:hypothetical protein